MKTGTQTPLAGTAKLERRSNPRGWIRPLSVAVLGVVLAMAGHKVWRQAREQHQLREIRQESEAFFTSALPPIERKLAHVADSVSNLRGELGQARVALQSGPIEISSFGARQRRSQIQLDEAETALRQLAAVEKHIADRVKRVPYTPLISRESARQVEAARAQAAQLREEMERMSQEISLARERLLQLQAAETAAAQLAQADSDAAQRPHAETLDANPTVASLESQTGSGFSHQADLAQREQVDGLRQAWSQVWLNPSPPPVVRKVYYLPLRPYPPNASLVIGSSYPDRFIGYRNFRQGWRCYQGPIFYSGGPAWQGF